MPHEKKNELCKGSNEIQNYNKYEIVLKHNEQDIKEN